jgi:polyhydroxybutyrate depolymerase
MKLKKVIIGTLLVIVGLPVLLIAVIVVTLSVLNETNGSIVSSGVKREYLLYVPKSYDRTKPTPLVISLHAAAMWPAHQSNTSGWNHLADSLGFIVVYPSGMVEGTRIWHVERGNGLQRDVRFISDLIDTLERSYHIDPRRIYANGLSLGGGMSFVLSCTISDRIAAVGLVAAALTLPWEWCTERRPVPLIEFHGTADPLVPFEGGRGTSRFAPDRFDPNFKPFPSVQSFVASWAERNQCGRIPTDSAVTVDVTRREYTHCADSAAVVLYTVQGAGHQWPGGKPMPRWLAGPSSSRVDATRVMWAFFEAHPGRIK